MTIHRDAKAGVRNDRRRRIGTRSGRPEKFDRTPRTGESVHVSRGPGPGRPREGFRSGSGRSKRAPLGPLRNPERTDGAREGDVWRRARARLVEPATAAAAREKR